MNRVTWPTRLGRLGVLSLILLAAAVAPVRAQLVPPQPNLDAIVKNKTLAIVLGKALFWDMQVGSDGMACASCHFSAGADSRIANQLSPGLMKLPEGDDSFGSITDFDGEAIAGEPGYIGSGAFGINSNYELKPEDFPTHHLEDTANRHSTITMTTDDAISSSGAFHAGFIGSISYHGRFQEKCGPAQKDVFHTARYAARRVEPRNTPTTINSVFNHVNFWDGRANNVFNGVGVFGKRDIAGDPNLRLIILNGAGEPQLGHLALSDASLASQAVGPPTSSLEMSCEGRTFADIGRRMLAPSLRPLATQRVHPQDSVLGKYIHPSGRGLADQYRYYALIQQAFDEKYWKAKGLYRISNGQLEKVKKGGYTQMEINFPAFWGIAIMLYEATLISDKSPFDDCVPTGNFNSGFTCSQQNTLSASALNGFRLFTRFGNNPDANGNFRPAPACTACHPAPLFSEAQKQAGGKFLPVERSLMPTKPDGVHGDAVHDRGFFNIATRPTRFDPGNGGTDPYGNPLSAARMFLAEQDGQQVVDPTGVYACIENQVGGGFLIEAGGTQKYDCKPLDQCSATPNIDDCNIVGSNEREAVDGSFKVPSLRNTALTPPYFHYGGYSSLRSMMDVYNRGGSHRDKSLVDASYTGDTSGSGQMGKDEIPVAGPDFGSNVDRFIQPLRLTEQEIQDIIALMLALTDRRVQCDQAPFDHPELRVPNGHSSQGAQGRAADIIAVIPATGAGGYEADGMADLCLPNTGDLFDDNLRNRLITQ